MSSSRPAALMRGPVIQIIGSETDWSRYSDEFALDLELPTGGPKVDSSLIALQMIAAGGGTALIMENYQHSYAERAQLVSPFAHRLPIHQSHFLVVPDRAERREEIDLFCQWVSAHHTQVGGAV